MSEETFEQALENFFEAFGRIIENFFEGFPFQIQFIASFIFAVIFLIIGYSLLKRNKKTAGYIFAGLGILAIVWKIIEILMLILF